MRKVFLPGAVAWVVVLAGSGCHFRPPESETRPAGETVLSAGAVEEALRGTVDFSRHVTPILRDKCLYCHEPDAMPGRYSLATREDAFADSGGGPRIVPGRPGDSPFVLVLKNRGHLMMPAVGNRTTAEERKILERWIAQGADWPAGEAGRIVP